MRFYSVELHVKHLRALAGNFGSSILAYFRFVKWLFYVNLFTFLIVLATVVLPQEIIAPDNFAETIADVDVEDTNTGQSSPASPARDRLSLALQSRDVCHCFFTIFVSS